jgi:nucleotidyltransferase substrate binding protein (TIGR01987 family)
MKDGHKDITMEHQFSDYRKALAKLSVAIDIFKPNEEENLELKEIEDLLKDGLIIRFEYTHELALYVMREYAVPYGKTAGEITRQAYKSGLINDMEGWMDMTKSRQDTTQMFNDNKAEILFEKILETYYLLFLKFEEKMGQVLLSN